MASNFIKQAGSKQGVSVVVWLCILGLVLFFFKSIMGFLNSFIGGGKTADDQKAEQDQKQDIENLTKTYPALYNKTPKPRSYYIGLATSLESQFNMAKTNWAVIDSIISKLTDMEQLALYIEFGSRFNTEYYNMQGDLADWILKEDEYSPLDFGKGKYVENIKKTLYRLSSTIPGYKKLSPYK